MIAILESVEQNERPRRGSIGTRAGDRRPRIASAGELELEGPATASPDVAEDMAEELLSGGEIILLMVRPSLLFIVLGASTSLIAICLAVVALALLARYAGLGLGDGQVFTLGAIALGARLAWQILEWSGRLYVLTDRRVVTRAGVLRARVDEVMLGEVSGATTIASPPERFTGLATIVVRGLPDDAPRTAWIMVRQPQRVREQILRAVRRYGRRG